MDCIKCGNKEILCKNICKQCYHKEYKKNNKEKIRKYNKGMAEKVRILQQIRQKRFRMKNKEKIIDYNIKYARRHPERIKAYNFANHYKQKNSKCFNCNSTENLHLHHTNYKKNEGITLCSICHYKIHKGR